MKDNSLESSKEYISKDISDFKRDTQLLRITAYLKFHIHKIGVVLTSGHAGKIKVLFLFNISVTSSFNIINNNNIINIYII